MKFLEKHKTSIILLTISLLIVWVCLVNILCNHLVLNYAYVEVTDRQGFMIFMQIMILVLLCPFWMYANMFMLWNDNKEKYYYMKVTLSECQMIKNYRSSKELKKEN